MMKRGLAWAVCAALAIASVGMLTPMAQAADVNVIPDAGLRQCLAMEMYNMDVGYSPSSPEYAKSISQADLDTLAQATTENYGWECTGVGSLSGLENLRDSNLQWLHFSDSTVTDFSVLAAMPSIYSLSIGSPITAPASITAIPASISKLTTITQLEIVNTQISDVTALTNMTWLTQLLISA